MTTVKGIYENGVIKLLEQFAVTGQKKVLVTFIEETDEELLRGFSLYQNTDELKNYLEDNNEDLYQDYLKK